MRTGIGSVLFSTAVLAIFISGSGLFAAVPAYERKALIALYKATDGDNWKYNWGWKEGELESDGFGPIGSEDDWYGIYVVEDHVKGIHMDASNLRGPIPPEIGDLKHIRIINLANNPLQGRIPPEIGKLRQLYSIYIVNAGLVGEIPPELGNLYLLMELHLRRNNLSGSIPPELGKLNNLQECDLVDNYLSGPIPQELGGLIRLKSLALSYNNLSGVIPREIGRLKKLEYVDLGNNSLAGNIPREICKLDNLRLLHLYLNRLTGVIPPEIGNMASLKNLNLSLNRLSGAIPPEIGNMENLERLDLGFNNFSGTIPEEIGELAKLKSLELGGNHLRPPIPLSLLDMESLNFLNIGFNALYTDNPEINVFFNKVAGSNWTSTQTVAPPDITASGVSQTTVRLSWTPIDYYYTPGFYQVYYSHSSTGPWEFYGNTTSKYDTSLDVTGLHAGKTYYFKVRTQSGPEEDRPALLSDFSAVVSGHTTGSPGEHGPPFGSFDTPAEGMVVSGSIPVTGWALDDSGIRTVKIYRESGGGLVFIGDAFLVEGARPDVAMAYPGYPGKDKAGWGYMLLTNFLPNFGNGTVKLKAIATDVAGKTTILGGRTIFCDNDNAIKPFGNIDTPLPGAAVSGKTYVNFGWALTPVPNGIPTDGSTITVWVDGVPLGHPVYNRYRSDIASLFQGYVNSNGAVGYFYLDTTAYENGVHTIQWTVTDDAGNSDGIGSRYFTIQNSQNRQYAKSQAQTHKDHGLLNGRVSFNNIPRSAGDSLRREIPELGRLKIQLKANADENVTNISYQGFQMVGQRVLPLPAGSYLDKRQGIFYWQPGVAFLGRYHLVFVKTDQEGKQTRRDVFVTIHPGQ